MQRRHHMPQRSPNIFWLLLAATLSVDYVAFFWMVSGGGPRFAQVAYDALVVGQLSIVCIWAGLRSAKIFWSRAAPWAAMLIAAVAVGLFATPQQWVGLPYYGLHVALLLSALWVFERTNFWRRQSGASSEWRYSLVHLLIAMTIVAILLATMRESQLVGPGDRWVNLAFICGSVVLAMFSIVD
jgi:hypothetical protein